MLKRLCAWLQVITKQVEGHKYEPYEEAVIEVPAEHVGPVVDMLGQRKGQMLDLVAGETGGLTRSLTPPPPFFVLQLQTLALSFSAETKSVGCSILFHV